jgi:hypothetical protein
MIFCSNAAEKQASTSVDAPSPLERVGVRLPEASCTARSFDHINDVRIGQDLKPFSTLRRQSCAAQPLSGCKICRRRNDLFLKPTSGQRPHDTGTGRRPCTSTSLKNTPKTTTTSHLTLYSPLQKRKHILYGKL